MRLAANGPPTVVAENYWRSNVGSEIPNATLHFSERASEPTGYQLCATWRMNEWYKGVKMYDQPYCKGYSVMTSLLDYESERSMNKDELV